METNAACDEWEWTVTLRSAYKYIIHTQPFKVFAQAYAFRLENKQLAERGANSLGGSYNLYSETESGPSGLESTETALAMLTSHFVLQL